MGKFGTPVCNSEKIAGKVFLNHTRQHEKEKAPNVGAFFCHFFLSAGDAALDSGEQGA
ncbi:hypothetical protein [Paraburkholderia sp. RL17-381-BIF-C]|jgi:hypothetical protein|uniref:hypothetical protein n=1 Tax=Paraburkholderia sp. RL17-381-BIF-C TaxID=3031635 RepID=UPI0038B7CC8C